ncbi:hypothetical protein JZ751_023605, partial [Albula glossodonta]
MASRCVVLFSDGCVRNCEMDSEHRYTDQKCNSCNVISWEFGEKSASKASHCELSSNVFERCSPKLHDQFWPTDVKNVALNFLWNLHGPTIHQLSSSSSEQLVRNLSPVCANVSLSVSVSAKSVLCFSAFVSLSLSLTLSVSASVILFCSPTPPPSLVSHSPLYLSSLLSLSPPLPLSLRRLTETAVCVRAFARVRPCPCRPASSSSSSSTSSVSPSLRGYPPLRSSL